MDHFSYQSFEEPRTAVSRGQALKSIQSWKTPKSEAQSDIIAKLNEATEPRTASFNQVMMAYAPQSQATTSIAQEEAFQFDDVLDAVNPLHHLPVVGMIYRSITGDELHPVSGIIGGAIYGGPIGAATGTVNAVSKIQTGKDIGEHAFSIFNSGDSDSNITTAKTNKTMTMLKEGSDSLGSYDDITTIQLAAMPPKRF